MMIQYARIRLSLRTPQRREGGDKVSTRRPENTHGSRKGGVEEIDRERQSGTTSESRILAEWHSRCRKGGQRTAQRRETERREGGNQMPSHASLNIGRGCAWIAFERFHYPSRRGSQKRFAKKMNENEHEL